MASILFPMYLATQARGIGFSDGGEIATAIASLGVMHPTGYPIFTVLAHFFTALLPTPFEISFEIEILNSVFGVGAALCVAAAVRRLGSLFAAPSSESAEFWPFANWAGAVAGFGLAITPLLWHQVRIPEVYAFHVFLTAWALYRIAVFEQTRREVDILWAALPMGLGLAHHVTMAYLLPPAAIYFILRKPWFFTSWFVCSASWVTHRVAGRSDLWRGAPVTRWWLFPAACLIGSLPLASYAYLLWANATTTGIAWGDVRDLQGVLEHATGSQYHELMAGWRHAQLGLRADQLPAQFLSELRPAGAILSLAGLWACLRHAPLLLVVFVGLALSVVAHGLQYAVADYHNYFLPALTVCYVLFGIGLSAVSQSLLPLFRNRPLWQRGRTLALLVLAGVTASTGLAAITRIPEMLSQQAVGAPHAESVAREVPPGAIYLTEGDGFVFAQWYYQHVRHQGNDFAALNVRVRGMGFNSPHVGWQRYAARHLSSYYPRECDPLWGPYADDPEAYATVCETFAMRAKLGRPDSWVKVPVGRYRTGKLSGAALDTLRAAQGTIDPELQAIVRGGDEACSDQDYRRTHREACYCWNYFELGFEVDERCVPAADEGGIVPMTGHMINAHRMIDDHIDERPVYERNVYTRWDTHDKVRNWAGPTHIRVSGDFALINRGSSNQIVYSRDVDGFDPCARDQLQNVRVPALSEVQHRPNQPAERRAYRPNFHPILLKASSLTRDPEASWYESARVFSPGETAYLNFQWFERYRYDRLEPSNRGKDFHHGVRACVFDPAGRKVWQAEIVSGLDPTGRLELSLPEDLPEGAYRAQACTVGELASETADFSNAACIRPILEYEFSLRANTGDDA